MKNLLILLFTFTSLYSGVCQQVDSARLVEIADSVIIANSSKDFLDYLLQNKRRIAKSVNYNVNYDFTLGHGELFSLKDDTVDCISYGAPIIGITIDCNYRVMKIPDFKALNSAYKKISESVIIERDSAIQKAARYFDFKRRSIEAIIEYDLINDVLYWRCTKTKSKRIHFSKYALKIDYEHVLINAESGEYIRNEIRYNGLEEKTRMIIK